MGVGSEAVSRVFCRLDPPKRTKELGVVRIIRKEGWNSCL